MNEERTEAARAPRRRGALPWASLVAVAAGCAAAQGGGAAGDTGSEERRLPDVRALLEAHPGRFGDLLARADHHRIKIECALVVDGPEGPTLERAAVSFGPDYFYPASSVKTCAVVAASQALAQLAEEHGAAAGLDTPLRFHPLFAGETVEERDVSHADGGTITAGHDLRKVMLVSDNAAYNRLYELAGPERIRASMVAAGLDGARIVHRLSEFRSREEQLTTPRVEVLVPEGGPLEVPARRWETEGNAGLSGLVFGSAHVRGAETVEGPMDFEHKNWMPLRDLLDMNVMLLQPEVRVPGRRAGAAIELLPADRERIAEAMAETPGASHDPRYDAADYPDDYSKFLLPGLLRLDPDRGWIVRDKIGRAYGFSVTNGQVIDPESGRVLYVAATLYTNENDVVGDGVYEYGRADRFFADFGEVLGRAVFGLGAAR